MGTKRNVDMSAKNKKIKIVKPSASDTAMGAALAGSGADLSQVVADVAKATKQATDADTTDAGSSDATTPEVAKKAIKQPRVYGKKYKAVRSQVDKTKLYDIREATELVKKLSYTSFDGTIELSIVVKEIGTSIKLSLPHSTGKTKNVAIMSEDLLKEIEAGNIDFDVLISTPEFMPKLAKYARILGPKGLMPNPKTGTLTPNPELKKKEFEAGSFTLKTNKKMPIMNLPIGKVSMKTEDIMENIEAILKPLTDKIVKMSMSASMSPGVKVKV